MQRLQILYPTQSTAGSADFPNGKFKNRQFVGDNTGSPVEMKWANNIWGALSGVLKLAGLTANDQEETANSSQVATAIKIIATAVLQRSFKYGSSANPTTPIECHALLRSATENDTWHVSRTTGTLTQISQVSGDNSVDLPIPYGRFQITLLGSVVYFHDSITAGDPLEIRLKRRSVSTGSETTLATLTYNTANNVRGQTLLPGPHVIENGYVYFIHFEGQNKAGAPDVQIRDVFVNLEQVPVTI